MTHATHLRDFGAAFYLKMGMVSAAEGLEPLDLML
jgi:hypothetical protein